MSLLKTAFYFLFTSFLLHTYGNTKSETQSDAATRNGIGTVYNRLLDDYDVKFYFIDIEVNDTSTAIDGSTSILVELLDREPETIVLDMGSMLHVDSVYLDQNKAGYLHENEELVIEIPKSFAEKELVSIQVFYHGSSYRRRGFGGIFNAEDLVWGNRVTWSLSEPFSARDWFPCKQVLGDKADSVYVFITTDRDLKAGSNGMLTDQTELPGGKIRHEWKSRYPIAYYLISFAVSDYRDYSIYAPLAGKDDSLLIQNYIYDNDVYFNNYRDEIDLTRDFIGLFEKLFGPYPFQEEKYGHCIVPSGGGMEHQTMTTLSNFSFSMVSHELAHQWFGDLVTCGTWQDIWINEGFASYAEYLAYQYLVSQEKADQWMASAQEMVKTRPDGSIYIPPDMTDDEGRIFDYRLSYKKGAAIIHMIRHEIHDDGLFFDILRDFISRYQNGTASATDFRMLLEERTSMDFSGFFDQWYYGEGYPIVSFTWQQNNDTLYIQGTQTTTSSTQQFNLRLDIRINAGGQDILLVRRLTSNHITWKIPVEGRVTEVQVDPFNWLLGEFTSLTAMTENLADHDSLRDLVHQAGLTGIGTESDGNNLYAHKIVKD